MVCRIVDCFHRQVFLHHLGKCLGNLIYIGFVLRFISFCGVRSGNIWFSVADLIVLCRKGITGFCIAEFCDSTDISCVQLRYFDRFGAFEDIQFIQFFFGFLIYIIEYIVALDDTGANLDHRIFSKERIHDRLENGRALRFCEIVICLENLVRVEVDAGTRTGGRIREVSADIIKKVRYALQIDRGAHAYRNDGAVSYVHGKRCGNLCYRELFSAKVAVHKLFTCFCHGFHQGFTVLLQIFYGVIWNRAFFFFIFFDISAAFVLYNIDISYKFTVFTQRHMKRCDSFSVQFGELLNDFSVADIVLIHFRYEDHTRKIVFLAEFPCFLGSDLHAGLSGYHDYSGICCGSGFLCFSYEIKHSRSIQNIDLIFSPYDRDKRCGNRAFALDFFFVKIADGISVCHFSETVCHTGKISHSFGQTCLSGAAVPQQHHISDSVSSKNVHM